MLQVKFPDSSHGSVYGPELTPIEESGDTENKTPLETYTELGEKLGTGALAQVAAIMDQSHANTQRTLDQLAEYDHAEAVVVARAYLTLVEKLSELNVKLDSMRLDFLLGAQERFATRAERIVEKHGGTGALDFLD